MVRGGGRQAGYRAKAPSSWGDSWVVSLQRGQHGAELRDGHGNVEVEIRQLMTADDLGFSQEQKERYDQMAAQQSQQ